MIDNHHLAYVGVLTVFVIGATVVALVWTLVLATAVVVAGFVRIRKRPKPIAAISANEDGPDDFSAPAASHPQAHNPVSDLEAQVPARTGSRVRAVQVLPALMSLPWGREASRPRHDSPMGALTGD